MSQDAIGVAITTNGRCIELLRFIINEWLRHAAEVCVATNNHASLQIADLPVKIAVCDTSPAFHGDAMQTALDHVASPYVINAADDILPVGTGWMNQLPRNPKSITAIRLLNTRGRRFYDWALSPHKKGEVQPYTENHPRTYITAGAQLISSEVRKAISYRSRPFVRGQDVSYCFDAVKAGFRLIAPQENSPTMIHLDST